MGADQNTWLLLFLKRKQHLYLLIETKYRTANIVRPNEIKDIRQCFVMGQRPMLGEIWFRANINNCSDIEPIFYCSHCCLFPVVFVWQGHTTKILVDMRICTWTGNRMGRLKFRINFMSVLTFSKISSRVSFEINQGVVRLPLLLSAPTQFVLFSSTSANREAIVPETIIFLS